MPRMIKTLRRFITLTCILYGVLILAYYALFALVGDTSTIIGLPTNLMPLPLLPAFVLLPLALIVRRWIGALFTLPALIAFVIAYGGLFVPLQSREAYIAPLQDTTFTLLTFNTYAKQRDIDATFEIIRQTDADIVLIQELNINLTERIQAELSEQYPYQFLRPRYFSVTGMGMLSKYPLEEGGYWRHAAHWGRQTAWITIADRRIAIFNVHTLAPFSRGRGFYDLERRAFDIDEVLTWFDTNAGVGDQIAAGDFNMTDQTLHYQRMTERFFDAYRTVGYGLAPTFPNFSASRGDIGFPVTLVPPFIRIDYVFHSPSLHAIDARVLPDAGGADHFPVLVTLGLGD